MSKFTETQAKACKILKCSGHTIGSPAVHQSFSFVVEDNNGIHYTFADKSLNADATSTEKKTVMIDALKKMEKRSIPKVRGTVEDESGIIGKKLSEI